MTACGVYVCDILGCVCLEADKTQGVVRSIGSVVPLLWSRCQLCWEELSDCLVTSHADAQLRAERRERGADTVPVNTTGSLFFLPFCFCLTFHLFLFFFFLPSISLPQAQTSPQNHCPSPPFWLVMSMTLWYCLPLVCHTGRNCCWNPLAPKGTLDTWWFALTMRRCSVAPRPSLETSQLSMR